MHIELIQHMEGRCCLQELVGRWKQAALWEDGISGIYDSQAA